MDLLDGRTCGGLDQTPSWGAVLGENWKIPSSERPEAPSTLRAEQALGDKGAGFLDRRRQSLTQGDQALSGGTELLRLEWDFLGFSSSPHNKRRGSPPSQTSLPVSSSSVASASGVPTWAAPEGRVSLGHSDHTPVCPNSGPACRLP